ncbi:uncharacterized protein N7477_003479 [Penicillium maclennaniae]|uniref:uncharacterized protein n=1 Tax=Penicillium maclennaniae TaxID=1343394 RepID=UPI0025423B6A|nr:uncharacterized protein N7477_003479 [Penicillium maclennaniae]KAJ5677846.1 hypothetical protein N7477_003479 [Penicillium maclennaniae]
MAPKRTGVAGKTAAKRTTTKNITKTVKMATSRHSASNDSRPLRYTPGRFLPRGLERTTPSPLEPGTADSLEFPSLASYENPVKKVAKRTRNVIEDSSSDGSSDASDSFQYQACRSKASKRARTVVKKTPAPVVEDSSGGAAGATSDEGISEVDSFHGANILLRSSHRPAEQLTRRRQPKRGEQAMEARPPGLDSPHPEEPKRRAFPIVGDTWSEASSDTKPIPSDCHSDNRKDTPDPDFPRPAKRTNTSKKVTTDSEDVTSSLFFDGLRETRVMPYSMGDPADWGLNTTDSSAFDRDPILADIHTECLPNAKFIDLRGMLSYFSNWFGSKDTKDRKESNSSNDVGPRSIIKEDIQAPYDGTDRLSDVSKEENERIEEIGRDHSSEFMSEDFEWTDAGQGQIEDNTMLWLFKDGSDVAEAQQRSRR